VISELHAKGMRLIVFLGRDPDKSIRKDFAELVRKFKANPTAALSELLEIEAQKVFLDAWRRGRADTGSPNRGGRALGWSLASHARKGAAGEIRASGSSSEDGSDTLT
jgi:hypothetical protein